LKEEKALREKAEARSIELRKKMREAKVSIGAPAQKTSEHATEDGAGPRTNATVLTKADDPSTAGSKQDIKPSSSTSSGIPNTAAPTTIPAPGNVNKTGQIPVSNGGMKNTLPPTNGVPSTTPMKSNVAPTRTTSKGIEETNEWHARSSSLGPESYSFLPSFSGDSINSSPANMNAAGIQQQNVPIPANVTRAASVTGQPGMQFSPKIPSKEFDPLRRAQSTPSGFASDVFPVISIPTQVSLVNGIPTVFQDVGDPAAFSASNGSLSTHYDQNTFMSENNLVSKTSGVDQPNVGSGFLEPSIGNGIHGVQHPSFMVFPQQQSIMLQQVAGGVQQVPNLIAGQISQTLTNNQGSFPQYTNPIFHSTDSFDPFKEI
jgi:hypothetical protein